MRVALSCLAAALVAASAAQATELTAVVRKPSVDVHAEPKFEATRVGTLEQGATVSIAAQSGLWYELKLAGGKPGFIRVNDVRVDSAAAEDAGANVRALTTAQAGKGHVTETAGVRGIDESDLKSAASNQAELDAMVSHRAGAPAAVTYAGTHGWTATEVAFKSEARPGDGAGVSAAKAASGAENLVQNSGGLLGSLGSTIGSLLGKAKTAAPKPEQEQAAEELALGPEIAGRVLGARPLWNEPGAQQRVNIVGRWVASQTSRPDLPWTFGVIDTPEVNAFAAPGGYILVTRGLYELLASDSEVAAVLGHEISHCVERDHYNVIHKQELATLGKQTLAAEVHTTGGEAQYYAREYVDKQGATIMLTALDRDAEFRADQAAEIYLARSGMNPMALYSVLQRMAALGEKSARLAALYKTHPPIGARLDKIDARGYRGLEAYIARE
jgi:beta-barrel assembly-enhancing protease